MGSRHATPVAAAIEAEARLLVGHVPYQHAGRSHGGMDWLGLVQACCEAALGHELPAPEDYDIDGLSIDAADLTFTLWGFDPIPLAQAQAGDVILFSLPGAHAAVLTEGTVDDRAATVAHVFAGQGCVGTFLGDWWRERAVRAYRYSAAPAVRVAS